MYTTPEDINRRINSNISSGVLNDYIDDAKAWIDVVTNTEFGNTTASTRIFETRKNSSLIIIDQAYEVTKVDLLIARTEEADTWQELTTTSYRLEPENNTPKTIVRFINPLGTSFPIYFYGGVANVRVTAKWGYSEEVPRDVARIASSYVIEQLRVDGLVDERVKSERLGDASVSYGTVNTDEVMMKLENQLIRYKDLGDFRI